MSQALQQFFAESTADGGYPKLIEGDPARKGCWVKFELANGRVLASMPERRAETFILYDGEEQIARAVKYLDEESDARTHVYSFFAREDYPDWHNADKNPHLELDYEVSNWGDLQSVSLSENLKSFDPDRKRFSWQEPRPYNNNGANTDNAKFILNEAGIIQTLNRFYDYALGTIIRGNKPDFEQLNVLFDEPFVTPDMTKPADLQTGNYDNFTI